MTPELKAALEAVLDQALDMGNSYQVPSQTMDELMEAFDAEPTEKDKKTSLIESTNKVLLKTIKKQNETIASLNRSDSA